MSSNQKTTLAAAITTTGQSSITVSAFVGFPTSAAFTILVDTELLRVTAGYGTTTWTVTRGYLSTTAATHSSGATVTYVPDAYADLDDLIATMGDMGTGRYALLTDMLADVSSDISSHCMRSFFVPTADETFYVDIEEAKDCLSEASEEGRTTDGRALDFVSITSLYVRQTEADAYVELVAGDQSWWLEPGPKGSGTAGVDWPWQDVELSPYSSVPVFWPGRRAVKIIGRLGFPVIPPVVKRATISETRERFRQSVGGGPMQIGQNAFGQPIFLTGMSPDMRRVLGHPFSLRDLVA